MANDFNTLNETLFQLLNDVKEGRVDEKKAQTMVNIGNALANNAKIQMAAFKLTNGKTGMPMLSRNADPKMTLVTGSSRSHAVTEVAVQNGYKNVAEAVAVMGKDKFNKAVDKYMDEHSAA